MRPGLESVLEAASSQRGSWHRFSSSLSAPTSISNSVRASVGRENCHAMTSAHSNLRVHRLGNNATISKSSI
jgi:hypothetical protein